MNYDHSPRQEAESRNRLVHFGCIIAGFFIFNIIDENKKNKEQYKVADEPRDTIEKAIKHRQRIAFLYTKYGGLKERRTIKPVKFVSYKRKSAPPQLCVQGHCYTRNADRTFALERMTDVAILDDV